MKYPPQLYAKAFVSVLEGKTSKEKLAENFITLIKKNGDWGKRAKIVAETEKLLRVKEGRRKVVIETARPLSPALQKDLKKFSQPHDITEEKIDPALVAGAKITIDDEMQFDGSLKRKIEKLFAS